MEQFQIGIPLWARRVASVALVVLGSWTSRRWTVVLAATIGLPLLWPGGFAICAALAHPAMHPSDEPAGHTLPDVRRRESSRSPSRPSMRRPAWAPPWTSCSATSMRAASSARRRARRGRAPARDRCPRRRRRQHRRRPRHRRGTAGGNGGGARMAPRLRLLRVPHGGKGAAVRAGMLAATADLIVFADADMATPPDQLPLLVAALADHDVALGSRIQPDGSDMRTSQPRYRRALGRVFHALASAWAAGRSRTPSAGSRASRATRRTTCSRPS